MNIRTVLTAVSATLWALVPESRAQYCNFPPKELLQGERREYRGLYENRAYDYSVVIPTDLVGYDGVNPFYQSGFGIIFGPESKSYIVVDSEKNSLEFTRPADAASQSLKYLRKHGSIVESWKVTKSQLGKLNATRLVARYTCPGSTVRYVTASIVALSPDNSNLYEITLYARSDRLRRTVPCLTRWRSLGTTWRKHVALLGWPPGLDCRWWVVQAINSKTILGAAYTGFACAGLESTSSQT
jgi:hypothetical protein